MHPTQAVELIPIRHDEFPTVAVEALHKTYRLSDETPDKPLYFSPQYFPLYRISHDNGDTTYVAHFAGRSPESLQTTFIIDMSSDGMQLGLGEVEWSPTDCLPYISWNGTEGEVRGIGLGRRRVLSMAAASLLIHGRQLHSGVNFCDDNERRIWERLVDEGIAERYTENSSGQGAAQARYRILQQRSMS